MDRSGNLSMNSDRALNLTAVLTSPWRVEIADAKGDGALTADVFDFVVLATGNFSRPSIPDSWKVPSPMPYALNIKLESLKMMYRSRLNWCCPQATSLARPSLTPGR